MELQDIIIIITATLIGLLYLFMIRRLDLYEKEPFLKLIAVSIVGGVISIIISIFLYLFVDVQYTFGDAMMKIGPIEELSKLIAMIIVYRFIRKDYNEIVDGLVYMAAVALGFAVIENIFYAFNSTDPFSTLFRRSIYTVLAHISFSGYLGLAFYIHVRVHKNITGIIIALLIASFAHGLYDGVIFQRELNIFFNLVFIAIIVLQFFLFKAVAGFSKFRKVLSREIFEESAQTIILQCSKCNSPVEAKGIKFWEISGVLCNSCGSLVLQGDNVIALLKYFRPILNTRLYFRKVAKNKAVRHLDDKQEVFFKLGSTILSSGFAELSEWLILTNKQDQQKLIKIPFIGSVLYYLGLRYVDDEDEG